MQNPWMHSVTLTLANTNYNLYTLMAAIEPAPEIVQRLELQADPTGGGAEFRVGNDSLSDTNYGKLFYATQTFPVMDEGGLNSVSTKGVYVRCNAPGLRIAVTALQH